MNTKLSAHGTRSAMTALAVLVTAVGMNVHGWSISGTVKNSSGTALTGVAVTVKDTAKYSTTTDASGNFKLESAPSAVLSSRANIASSFSVQVARGELLVRSPRDGSLGLSLVNSMGRSIWTADVVSAQGVARVAFPTKLGHGAVFLQIKHANGVENHSVVWGADGLHIAPSQSAATNASVTSAAAAAANPIILFKKADYRDTSFTMTSETMTNVAVAMASSGNTCPLPTTYKWTSSGILVDIKPDGSHNMASVKDPTIQKYNGNYLIYCTIFNKSNNTWSMQFIKFSDFSQAAAQTPFFMDKVSGFGGYKCAPELFYYEPKQIWYLIWQQQDPAYSTTTTPDVPTSWSAPKTFFNGGMPGGIKLPIDYFPIADANNFYIFFTGDDGKVYRIKTTLASFPSGFGSPVVAKSLNGTDIIFEGSSHYKIKGTTNTYLHLVEGQGSTGRVYSSWTSEGIEGTWQNHKVGSSTPFAGKNNVTFPAGVTDWSDDVSHGELLRDNPNQEQILDPCKLQLLYQGQQPGVRVDYSLLPYKLGLLTLQ